MVFFGVKFTEDYRNVAIITPKNNTSKLNFKKKKISILERGLRFGRKIGKQPFWDVGRIFFFFFVEKKVDHRLYWGGIHWRLP